MMIRTLPFSLILAASVTFVSCDQDQQDEETSSMERRIKELEEKTSKDLARQKELEQELSSHKLAMEWAAIERERMEIEARRADLESKGDQDAELNVLKSRDEALATREALAQRKQAKQFDEQLFPPGGRKLPSEAKLPLAGLEAGAFAEPFDASYTTVDYQYFNDALSPYGTWYDTDEYGSVWQPAVCREPNWRPYTRGHWVCSDRGWTWVSSEPFGWATYHYGRWALLQNRGWIWVPGTQWAPSWCTWRSSDTHIGWAPLPPETLVYQNCEWDSRVERQYGIGASCFNFVRTRHFDHNISLYCIPRNLNRTCLNSTTNITKFQISKGEVFCGGPGYQDLSDKLGRRLPYYKIHRHNNSYKHQNPAYLRCRVKGEHLMVAAPGIRKGRPTGAFKRLTEVNPERSKSVDPQVLDAYRQMRKREINPPNGERTISQTTKPGTHSPITQIRKSAPPSKARSSAIATRSIPASPTIRKTPTSLAQQSRPVTRLTVRPTRTTNTQTSQRQKEEAQLQAFREMARQQRSIASAERARRESRQAADKAQQAKITQQQLVAVEAERQEAASRQARSEAQVQQQQAEAQRKKRDEEQRRWAADQRRQQEEIQRIKLIDEQRRQQLEDQRRLQEAAQRRQLQEQERQRVAEQQRQREEAQRQRAAEQQRQQQEAQRRQQEQAQRKAREDDQRRSQEEAQRRERDDQQRQRGQRSK